MPDPPKKSTADKWWDFLMGRKVLEQAASPPKDSPPPLQSYDYVKESIARWQAEQARVREEEAKKKQPGAGK
jgi:hypothetical protein